MKTLSSILSRFQFKRDPVLVAFAVVLVLACTGLVMHGDITWKEASAFLAGALALPGLFGKSPAVGDASPTTSRDEDAS